VLTKLLTILVVLEVDIGYTVNCLVDIVAVQGASAADTIYYACVQSLT
jgi:hypothetical protein